MADKVKVWEVVKRPSMAILGLASAIRKHIMADAPLEQVRKEYRALSADDKADLRAYFKAENIAVK